MVSKVFKRTVVRSQGDRHEVSLFTSGTLSHLHMLVFTTITITMVRTCSCHTTHLMFRAFYRPTTHLMLMSITFTC